MRRFLRSMVPALIVGLLPIGAYGSDQETAQKIAEALRASGRLTDYSIGVTFEEGRAKLLGRVASDEQAQTAVEMAQQLPYVSEVENRLEIKATPKRDFAVQPTGHDSGKQTLSRDEALFGSSQPKSPNVAALPAEEMQAAPVQQAGGQRVAAAANRQGAVRQTNGIGHHHAQRGGVVNAGGAPMGMQGNGGPIPVGIPASSQPQRVAYDQPNMPCYSWPSYASHPNYAAVTYPNQYSASAWPYIGPFYPYPQVPLGWRRVCLEWKDGWWFLDFNDHCRTFRR